MAIPLVLYNLEYNMEEIRESDIQYPPCEE